MITLQVTLQTKVKVQTDESNEQKICLSNQVTDIQPKREVNMTSHTPCTAISHLEKSGNLKQWQQN
jgi:hypothetical protein